MSDFFDELDRIIKRDGGIIVSRLSDYMEQKPKMKLKVLTTSDKTDHPGWHKLKSSLEKHGYDYEHILKPFSFGHQLPVIRDWCTAYTGDCTHILYTDCFDTLCFTDSQEVIKKYEDRFRSPKMLISAEKNCYPLWERAGEYPDCPTPWKYVNGGGWMVEIEYFKELCKIENLTNESHDQVWLMDVYLRNKEIQVDNNCEIFQTIAFSNREEWIKEEGRFRNVGTNTLPVFFHGNGHTDMSWLYD